MAVIKTNSEQTRLLARLMRAEAEGEGSLGMLMVGNVGVNRILGNCLDFNNIRSIRDMVYQSPGGFEAPQKSYFYQRAREQDIRLAQRAINGERFWLSFECFMVFSPHGRLSGNLVQSIEYGTIQKPLLLQSLQRGLS